PPSAVTAVPAGPQSRAAVAGPPSPENPHTPVPARVVIVPLGDTRLTRSPSNSAIKMPPSAVTATPSGRLSRAAVAGPPSPEKPLTPVPAMVVIIPLGDTRRTRLFSGSAMRKPPSAVTATALAELNRAAVAGPPSPEKP